MTVSAWQMVLAFLPNTHYWPVALEIGRGLSSNSIKCQASGMVGAHRRAPFLRLIVLFLLQVAAAVRQERRLLFTCCRARSVAVVMYLVHENSR